MDWAKITARRNYRYLAFGFCCALYQSFEGNSYFSVETFKSKTLHNICNKFVIQYGFARCSYSNTSPKNENRNNTSTVSYFRCVGMIRHTNTMKIRNYGNNAIKPNNAVHLVYYILHGGVRTYGKGCAIAHCNMTHLFEFIYKHIIVLLCK